MDIQTCEERLLNHRCDVINGSEHDLALCESSVTDPDSLAPDSNNHKNIIEQNVTTVLSFETFSLKIHISTSFYFIVGKRYFINYKSLLLMVKLFFF